MKRPLKILFMQPNYAIAGKRSWQMAPYGLALINACLGNRYEIEMFDPNFKDLNAEEIRAHLIKSAPDIVGITSFSTEYISEINLHTALVKETLPECTLVLGGTFPTVLPEKAIADPHVDFCILGEGEKRFPALLRILEDGHEDFESMDGLAFKRAGQSVVMPPRDFVDPLDEIPFPDYGNLDINEYGNFLFKFAHCLVPRQFPFAMTITARGCPFDCIFCAARTVSGTKVRLRSAENVLAEIDDLCLNHGMKEIIFLDDHFLHSRKRALEISKGIKERGYGITWKCGNVAVFSLTEQLLEVMRDSGSYQLTLSLESGNQEVLKDIIRKPVDLNKSREMVRIAKSMGYEVISNFIIGFPGETWDQIRRTIAFAQSLDLDLANFHIATPLPKTRLMEICLEEGYIKSEDDLLAGYTKGVIETDEFSSMDLQILRAYEWDRINFNTPEKVNKIASIEGVSEQEVAVWRKDTRRSLGSTLNWKDRSSCQIK